MRFWLRAGRIVQRQPINASSRRVTELSPTLSTQLNAARASRSKACPSRKPRSVLNHLQLERSSAILPDRPAHPYSDGLLQNYDPHLSSLFVHPEPDHLQNGARGRESRPASATGCPQPKNSPAATASAGSILLCDSLATLDELAGGVHNENFVSQHFHKFTVMG